jgi:hypothetical protein
MIAAGQSDAVRFDGVISISYASIMDMIWMG